MAKAAARSYVQKRVSKNIVVPEPKLKRKALTQDGVTLMQEEYLHHIVAGLPMIEAYSKVFDVGEMHRSMIYARASRTLDIPAVGRRLQVLIEDKRGKMLAADAKFLRMHVTDRLMIESLDATSPAAARIKALELLGKVDVVGMFTEKVQVEQKGKRSSKEVEEEIKSKLEAYLKGLKTIDHISGTKEEERNERSE